jgi:2-methylisocitrate lyase-like PEP mutase family enzyme
MTSEARAGLRDLHQDGTFVPPNPFDAGSARLLQSLGAKARRGMVLTGRSENHLSCSGAR